MMSALAQSSWSYTGYWYDSAMAERPTLLHTALYMPAVDAASLAGSRTRLSLSAVAFTAPGMPLLIA